MITTEQIEEISSIYRQHGWVLRRLLLTKSTRESYSVSEDQITIHKSDVDAAWFSRPPKTMSKAWEIRYLGNPPFALLENLDESDPDFEDKLRDAEKRLKRSVTKKNADPVCR